jgi:hypothetical protein
MVLHGTQLERKTSIRSCLGKGYCESETQRTQTTPTGLTSSSSTEGKISGRSCRDNHCDGFLSYFYLADKIFLHPACEGCAIDFLNDNLLFDATKSSRSH